MKNTIFSLYTLELTTTARTLFNKIKLKQKNTNNLKIAKTKIIADRSKAFFANCTRFTRLKKKKIKTGYYTVQSLLINILEKNTFIE